MLRKFDLRRNLVALFVGIFAVVGSLVSIDEPARAAAGDASTVDYALSFNGTSDQLEAAQGTQYVARATYTVEVWVNPSNVTCVTSSCAVASHDGDWWFGIRNGTYQFLVYHTNASLNSDFVDTGITATANSWTHLALVRNGTTVTFYVNGKDVKTFTVGAGASTYPTAYPLKVGRHYNNEYFTGLIDELKLWSTARDAVAIASDMHTYQTSASSTSGLVAYFDFNEGGSNTTINNRVGSGGNLSFTNANPVVNFVDVKTTSRKNGRTILSFPRTYLTPNGGWIVPDGVTRLDALAVGGGGGGAENVGAGGSGGGFAQAVKSVAPASSISVIVGQGGRSGTYSPDTTTASPLRDGGDGQSSRVGFATALIGAGGIGGQTYWGTNQCAGSSNNNVNTSGVSGSGGDTNLAGGTGGKGAPGSGTGTNGGSGNSSSITGSPVAYGAGGKGGDWANSIAGSPGQANTGNGGGGGGIFCAAGATGGSGLVVIAYASSEDRAFDFPSNVDAQLQAVNKQIVPSQASFTFETWFKADSLRSGSSTWNDIFRQQATSSNFGAFGLGVYDGQIQFLHSVQDSDPGTFNSVNTNEPLLKVSSGRWYHVALVTLHSGSGSIRTYEWKVYVNGKLATTRSFTTSAASTLGNAQLSIGNLYGATGTRAWDGKLDQIKVWNGALSQSELERSMHTYAASSVVDTSGSTLRAHYDFNTQDQNNLIDQTGNGYDFALRSGATAPTSYQILQNSTVAGKSVYTFERTYLTAWGGWVPSIQTSIATALVTGGGGGGGSRHGGGGGAGEVGYYTGLTISSGSVIRLKIGLGGAGFESDSNNTYSSGTSGQSSIFGGDEFLGGGGGQAAYGSVSNGGSGGGTAGGSAGGLAVNGAGSNSSPVLTRYASAGASGNTSGTAWFGGGGGGATSAGSAATTSAAGAGGQGYSSSISGLEKCYAAGGGGGASNTNIGPAGTCQNAATSTATAGTFNTAALSAAENSGSGGGAGGINGSDDQPSGSGGSGVVVVSVKVAHDLTFNANGGSGSIATQHVTFGSSANLTLNNGSISKSGYTFVGWATSSTGTVAYADGASITPSTDTTLYAQWLSNATISGNKYVGQTLTADALSTPTPGGAATSFNYQWQRASTSGGSFANISGATNSTYALTCADVGKYIRVNVTGIYANNVSGSPVTSAVVGKIEANASSVVTNDDLILYLDAGNSCSTETSGSWKDLSGNGNNATLSGSPTLGSGNGGAFAFTGTQYGDIGTKTFDFSGGFSISFWANFGSVQDSERIIDFGSGAPGSNVVVYRVGNGQVLGLYAADGTNALGYCSATNAISDNSWAHYAITFDASNNCVIYKNGTSLASATTNTISQDMPNVARTSGYIGKSLWSANPNFEGSLGDIAIYKSALTSTQITTNYNAQRVSEATNPVISSQPANASKTAGQTASFSVTATASGTASYQWQVSTDSGSSWTNISGATSSTYTTGTLTTSDNAKRYRVQVTNTVNSDAATLNSSSATLTVSLPKVNVQFDELIFDFSNVLHVVGTNGKSQGDKVLFRNVTTKNGVQVDALVTTEQLSNATIANYESGTGAGGSNGYFQADVDIAAANGFAKFKFDFYQHGVAGTSGDPCKTNNTTCSGSTKVTLQNVNVSAIDIDYYQWNDLTGVESYTIASATKLKECAIPSTGTCTARQTSWSFPADIRAQGSADTARTNDPVDMIIANYGEIETFSIKFGRSATGKPNYYGVAFKALSWGVQTPQTVGGSNYTITYDANGATGNLPTANTGAVGANITLPGAGTLTKAGFTFAGWNTASDGTGTTYSAANVVQMPTAGMTLYAKWTANQYMLIYKLYGGVNGPATEMRNTGATANLSSVQPNRDGSVFSSWNTAADGTGTTYAPGASFTMPSANTTLHAMYSVATGTIAYSANNGSGAPANATGTSGTTTTAAAAGSMSRTNYTFSGWNTAANGSGTDFTVGASVTFPANGTTTTLYAQWTPVLYSYNYNANGGSGAPAGSSAIAGASVSISATTPTRIGYTFAGWTTAADGTGTVYSNGGANPTLTMPGANSTLYAKWTAVTYTLTFDSNAAGAGSNPTAATGTYGQNLTIAAAPSAPTGKKFNGWNTLANGSGSTFAAGGTFQITADVTLFAQWVDDTVNLFYSANGGSGAPTSITALANQNTTLSATVPTRTGYTFAGWTTNANGSGTVYGSGGTFLVPGSDTTLYAKWTAVNYSFAYNANGGSGAPATVNYHIGDFVTIDNSGNTLRNGYSFAGWNTAANGSGSDYLGGQNYLMADSNVTLYAKWTSNPYTLTYNANGGSGSPAAETRNAGASAALSSTAPTRSGYTFNGWNSAQNGTGTNYSSSASFTMPTSNSTIYAQWVLNSNALSYNANNGAGAPAGSTQNFGSTVTVSSTLPTRSGYNFLGWNTRADGTGTNYAAADTFSMPDSSVVLYARWAAVQKMFTYDANGGSGVESPATYSFGSTVTVTSSVPSRSGYTFVGWNSLADGSGTTSLAASTFTMPANDVTVYAIWSVNAYTVYYNMNGGTGSISPQPGTFGTSVRVSATTPSRTGFTFSGWNTLADGTGSDYTGGGSLTIPASNVTLFAKWTAILYSVSYNANGGSNGPADITGVTAGVRTTLSGSAPQQNGYVFNGWNTAANGNGSTYAGGQTFVVPAANTVLYAQWVANTYEIIYNPNGGSGAPAPANGTTNSSITLSATAPTRSGYTFVRWNTDVTDVDTNTRYASGAAFTVPAGNTIFYAIWELADITVSYNVNGGSGTTPGSATDKYLSTITLAPSSAFSRSGYTFNGWNTAADGSGASYAAESNFVVPDTNQTLYAQWSQIFYAIEYNPNGGTGAPTNQFAASGQNVSVSNTEPSKSGYDFNSWTLVNQGTTVTPGGTITMPDTNVVLVANWVRIASAPSSGGSSPIVAPTPEPTKPVTPNPSPKPVVKSPSKLALTVYFKGDSAVLQPTAKSLLNGLAKKARAKGYSYKIQVIGRVKETPDKSYDMRLSKQRATNVANYLKRLGVKGVWSVTAAGISPENKAISRRVDMVMYWK